MPYSWTVSLCQQSNFEVFVSPAPGNTVLYEISAYICQTWPVREFNDRAPRFRIQRSSCQKDEFPSEHDKTGSSTSLCRCNIGNIDLSHNYLPTLPNGVLSPLTELSILRLRYNQFKTISCGTFSGATRLEELYLTGNEIAVIPSDALSQLTGLHKLILRSNRLNNVGDYAFNGLPLLYLDIGENAGPVQIPPEALCGMEPQMLTVEPGVIDWSGLQTLLLDHNGLSTLHPCIGKLVWTLSRIDLSGNPLHCDCQVFLFRDDGRVNEYSEAKCATPGKLAGNYLDEIPAEWYDCSRNRTALSFGGLCNAPPPPRVQDDTGSGVAASAVSEQNVILAQPLIVLGAIYFSAWFL